MRTVSLLFGLLLLGGWGVGCKSCEPQAAGPAPRVAARPELLPAPPGWTVVLPGDAL